MPRFFRVIFACLVLSMTVLPACPRAWADSKPQHQIVVQTFEPARNNGTPLVQVRFSNTLVGTFIVDTGEIESVLTEPFARKANFNLVEDADSLAIGLHHVRIVQPPEIRLENLTVVAPAFRVVSQDFIPKFDGRTVDGILGGNLLSQFALKIDYPAHEIDWITPGNLDDKSAAELGFTPQNRVELGQERSDWVTLKINHYSIAASFQNGNNTASEDMFIDTGSPSTLVSADLADQLRLRSQATESVKILDRPAASYRRSAIGKMQIGQTSLADVAVLASQRKDTGIPPILGENVLSNCVVLLDFGPHRFYLKPVLPPTKDDSLAPLDKKQILWDRLRAAPDLPTIEEMLADGFAPDAQDSLTEQVAHLQAPDLDGAKDIARLEKLGALLRLGQDKAGAKSAFAQAGTQAKAAAAAHPDDGILAGQWVDALTLADRDDEAIAAAMQTTMRLPSYAPGWRHLGDVLMSHALFLLAGARITFTEAEMLRLMQGVPDSVATPAQSALVQPLLTQAYAAFNKSIALAPTDSQGYRERGLFRLASRIALTSMQHANVKITLPAPEVPSEDMAKALAIADWQQGAVLNANDVKLLAVTADLDQQMPVFHDRPWLAAHLKGTQMKGTQSALPLALMTTADVQARLKVLTQSADKTLAASAWTALGTAQAGTTDSSSSASSGSITSGVTQAESSWRQALALNPAQSDALTALASRLHQDGRWVELSELLTHQTAVCDTVPTRLALASVLSAENLPAPAEAQVRAALALAPGNATVNLILADLLLARSSGDAAALSEAAACLSRARLGYGTLATGEQKATLTTAQAVWLALDHDPDAAEKQLVALAREQPNCTQAREALAALIPYQ